MCGWVNRCTVVLTVCGSRSMQGPDTPPVQLRGTTGPVVRGPERCYEGCFPTVHTIMSVINNSIIYGLKKLVDPTNEAMIDLHW